LIARETSGSEIRFCFGIAGNPFAEVQADLTIGPM